MTGNGLLLFHQGWTDIINCLPLVSYFQQNYQTLLVFHKQEAADLVRYYCKQYGNIQFLEMPNEFEQEKRFVQVYLQYLKQSQLIGPQDFHIIGVHDHYREDQYKNVFLTNKEYFSIKFYTGYGIPHSVRLDFFSKPIDDDAERLLYEKERPANAYIVVHDTETNQIALPEITLFKKQLHGLTSRFLDAYLLLKDASEIHVIDSVWAAVCYSLDGKYRCFSHIPIYVYCQRGHDQLFTKPVQLPNWTIV